MHGRKFSETKKRIGRGWRVSVGIVAFAVASWAGAQAPDSPAPRIFAAEEGVPQRSVQVQLQESLDAIETTRGVRTQPLRAVEPLRKTPAIALILPGKSSMYGSAAQAVRTGFMAAATAAQAQDSCLVIEHGVGEVMPAFRQATEAGAQVMVGPLVRDDLEALLALPPLAWTIALTQFEDEEIKLPSNIFPLTLTVESDARFLAREIFTEGRPGTPVVLSGETPLMKRFADAFIDEWLRLGEAPPQRVIFASREVSTLKDRLAALSPSVVLLAVEGNDAALARAQTKVWPTYASGHIYQRQEQFEGFAFDQLRVVEIPWLITPQAERFKALPSLPPSPALARLYALGYDAFQTASAFLGGPPSSLMFEGASGSIRFDRKEGLLRNGQMAVFEGGHLLSIEALRP